MGEIFFCKAGFKKTGTRIAVLRVQFGTISAGLYDCETLWKKLHLVPKKEPAEKFNLAILSTCKPQTGQDAAGDM